MSSCPGYVLLFFSMCLACLAGNYGLFGLKRIGSIDLTLAWIFILLFNSVCAMILADSVCGYILTLGVQP